VIWTIIKWMAVAHLAMIALWLEICHRAPIAPPGDAD
jgi:hypothetical protein